MGGARIRRRLSRCYLEYTHATPDQSALRLRRLAAFRGLERVLSLWGRAHFGT